MPSGVLFFNLIFFFRLFLFDFSDALQNEFDAYRAENDRITTEWLAEAATYGTKEKLEFIFIFLFFQFFCSFFSQDFGVAVHNVRDLTDDPTLARKGYANAVYHLQRTKVRFQCILVYSFD